MDVRDFYSNGCSQCWPDSGQLALQAAASREDNSYDIAGLTYRGFLQMKNVKTEVVPDFDCYVDMTNKLFGYRPLQLSTVACYVIRNNENTACFTYALGTDSTAVLATTCTTYTSRMRKTDNCADSSACDTVNSN